MPYISFEQRRRFDRILELVQEFPPRHAGELNYLISMIMLEYVNTHNESYATFNDIMGAVDGAQSEFYRRVIAPYEDGKIQENGDVY